MGFHLTKHNSPSPMNALCEVFSLLFPIGKGCDPSCKEELEFPLLKDVLCQVLLKLGNKFLNVDNVFSLFRFYFLLEGRGTSFEQIT